MPTDYETIYRERRHALGAPSQPFVDFFDGVERPRSRVLDIGCGQGRDALFIARLGHRVTAVDLSATGVRQLREDAVAEGLEIDAVAADIRSYRPGRAYDVIVIDRTLHMLARDERVAVLRGLLAFAADGAAVLIADEKANIALFARLFDEPEGRWRTILRNRGYLFVRRA